MKFTSWPKPPIRPLEQLETIPEIPKEYTLFGLKYLVIDGNPKVELPSKPLDMIKMKESIDKSLKLFIKYLKRGEGSILNELRDLHIEINEEINKAKTHMTNERNSEHEGKEMAEGKGENDVLIKAKNRKTEIKNKIIREIFDQTGQ